MKKVLLIMSIFHEYHNLIIQELENQNYEVTFMRDNCDLNVFEQLYNKIDKNYASRKYNKIFYKKINEKSDTRFNFILIVFGANYLNKFHFKTLKQIFKCKVVYYTWDSVESFPIIREFFAIADKSYSFDKNDAIFYHVNFLPLFYVRSYNGEMKTFKWMVSTVMTVYPQKICQIYSLLHALPLGISKNLYFYFSNFLLYYKMMFKYRNILKYIKSYSHFNPIAFNEMNYILENSFCILDSPIDLKRNGLSMRVIEGLALHKKVITMHESIKEYDFYTPNNIFVVTNKNDKIPDEFFAKPFDENFLLDESYNIVNFVKTLTKLD